MTADELARRKSAETETDHDLQKDVQQFLADVHEEADHPWPDKPYDEDMTLAESRIVASLLKLAGVHKRTTALLTVTAHQSQLTARLVIILTVLLSVLTAMLLFYTCVLVRVARHTDDQIYQIREHAEQYWKAKDKAPASTGQKDEIGK